jgi:hypothetical protein
MRLEPAGLLLVDGRSIEHAHARRAHDAEPASRRRSSAGGAGSRRP